MKNSKEQAGSGKSGLLCRALGTFTEIRGEEVKIALMMTLTIFLILTSYLIAKVVREPLILSGGGAELKSYASAIQVGLLFFVIRIYTMCVCSFSRRRLINSITLFFVFCLLAFWVILTYIGTINGIIFYLWSGIFSLVVIAQFWTFANDVYTAEQGKRLFVLLAFGASAGGVFGPTLSSYMLDLVGLYNLLLVSAGLLSVSLLLINYIEPRISIDKEHCTKTAGEEANQKEVSHTGALSLLFQNRYLVMIAFLMLLSNWVNTTGEYILGKSVEETVSQMFVGLENADVLERNFIGGFYADFYSIVGFAGLVIQLLVVSRVVKFLGVRFALMTLPLIALGGYATIAVIPVLGFIQWAKTAENSTDYSLNSTVRQILFLPTTREEKYKVKVTIDTIFVRAGDLLSAGLVFVGVTLLSFSISQFALISMVLTVIWLVLAFYIGRENKKLVTAQEITNSDIT